MEAINGNTISRRSIIIGLIRVVNRDASISERQIDRFSKFSNHYLAQKYYECAGVMIYPIMSNYFMTI